MIYCLHFADNRPVREGEELVIERIDTGRLAFVSMRELGQVKEKHESIWADLLDRLLFRSSAMVSKINIPAGAHLLLRNVPSSVQESLWIAESEEVILTPVSGRAYSYANALALPDQTKVLLQDLCEGVEATVLCLSDISAHPEESQRAA